MPVIVLDGVPHFADSQVPVDQVFVALSDLIPLPFRKRWWYPKDRIKYAAWHRLVTAWLSIIQDPSANTEGKTGEGEQRTGTGKIPTPNLNFVRSKWTIVS